MNNDLNKVTILPPFKRFCMTIGELPSSYLDSMTYYEMLLWFTKYLGDTIIPTINANGEAVIELQEKYIELKDYVDNYFENLDVQEEINNKLDDMADKGELAEIISVYLQMASVLGYDTKSALKGAENIVSGSICKTLGNSSYETGDGHFYKIRDLVEGDIIDDDNLLALTNYPELVAEKIPDYLYNTLDSRMDSAETSINNLEDTIYKYPIYNVLENGGHDDGSTDNTSVLTTAYANGYNKFYFPQNEDDNAVYYFADNLDFTNYEIMTDEGVIFSVKNAYCITKGKYLSDVKVYARAQEEYFTIPKDIPDLFNSCHANIDYSKSNFSAWSDVSGCTLILYDFSNDGKFKVSSNPITNYYTNDGIYYKMTNNPTFNAVCVPLNTSSNCVETNTPITETLHGIICDSSGGYGMYFSYNGSSIGYYDETKTYHTLTELNIHKHNKPNNNFSLPMSYKIKWNPEDRTCEFYINDSLVAVKRLWFTPNYAGFGVTTANQTFTRLTRYYQKHVPMRYKLNILIAGDSRFYPGGRSYQIENVLYNSLKFNGINSLNIDNKSVSGYTLSQISSLIQTQTASEYDIVIIEGGINDYQSTANSIANTTASMISYCKNNGIIPILTSCIPTAPNGSDGASGARAEKYYMIENGMTIGYGTANPEKGKFIDNISGLTTNDTILPISPDGVHPSQLGIVELGKGITNAILTIQ